jgi:hypothetical protein
VTFSVVELLPDVLLVGELSNQIPALQIFVNVHDNAPLNEISAAVRRYRTGILARETILFLLNHGYRMIGNDQIIPAYGDRQIEEAMVAGDDDRLLFLSGRTVSADVKNVLLFSDRLRDL